MPERHSHLTPAGRAFWLTEKLWEAARGLPAFALPIADIAEFDQDCWFGATHAPTCRAVAEHARRIQAADLSWPVILAADGALMDGGHRIAKAWLLGHDTVQAVRFEIDPPPEYVRPA